MNAAWSFALARLAGALAFAVAGGLIFGRADLWLVAVLGGYLALQLANLYRLHRWLRHRREEDPPDLGGVWGDVVALVGRIYRRKNFHKRRIVQLLREFRRLTAAMPDGVLLLSPAREIVWFNRTDECLRVKAEPEVCVGRVDGGVARTRRKRSGCVCCNSTGGINAGCGCFRYIARKGA